MDRFVKLLPFVAEPQLSSERLLLRPLQPADVTADYVDGLNDPAVNRYLVDVRKSRQTKESVLEFVGRNLEAGDARLFGLFPPGSAGPIGTVRLHGVDQYNFTAAVGVCIFSRAHWGQGFGSEAVERVARFAFDQLGLHYLEACTYLENPASTRLFLKAGFKEVTVVRDKYRLDDKFADIVVLARTNAAFDLNRLHRAFTASTRSDDDAI